MIDDISYAVALIRNSPNLRDVEIYRVLVTHGVRRERAARLVEFIPTAYARVILRDSGARFSNMFRRTSEDGSMSPEQPLSAEPIWNQVVAFALAQAKSGVSGKDLLAVAIRSPEFSAANQLLNKGSKLEDIVFTALALPWPEFGPDLV